MTLSTQELTLIAVTLIALTLIVSNRLRPDLVAVLVLLSLALTGVVTSQEAIAGFSNPAVITIIALFVITHGLDQTGVIQWIARRIRRIGRGSEPRLIFMFMTSGALLSLVMNNIAAGAVLLPAAVRVGRDSNVRLSKLLIPLSFGTLVGGMATYFTTANIVMSGLLEQQGLEGLGMLDFIPTGGLIVIAGILYMLLIGRFQLPSRETFSQSVTSSHLYDLYELDKRLWEVQVRPESRLVSCELRESGIGERLGLTVMGIWRGHRAILTPEPDQEIRENDYLLILGREDRVSELEDWGIAFRHENYTSSGIHNYEVELSEVIIPPRSEAIGKSLTDLNYRRKYGLTAVALWRGGRSYRTDVGKMRLQEGDALLMVGPGERMRQFARERGNYLMLHANLDFVPAAPDKAVWALLITALVLIASVFDVIALPILMLMGAAAMIITDCMKIDDAYRAVEWRVVFLIAGMLPINIAMINTGLAERIGQTMIDALAGYGPLALIVSLFVLTTLVTQLLGGQVTALVIGPIAISSALAVDVNPQATAVAVAIACSTAFLTPIAHAVNVLMMGPGGYRAGDFFKVGLGMTLVTLVMVVAGLVLFWGIR
jgi:di/tricarboxylate transporter